MKKFSSFVISFFMMMIVAQQTLAVCTYNGEVVPCDQIPKWPLALIGIFFIFMMLMLAFWVWMIVDVAKYEKEDLAMWILIIVLTGFIGAIIYYFVKKRNRKALNQTTDNIQQNVEQKTEDK